jgi:phenylpropionate dioxygenase-like ring-hydroxylating dioxygenase large terminal subunit
MVDVLGPDQQSKTERSTTEVPNLRGDIRHLIPVMGLRNYWYPAIAKRRIPKRRPTQVKMLGEDICIYRGAREQAVAVRDVCPHRGARLSEGTCHWKGTVSCPYHGWTFDEQGKNVAVLSEGPDSKICGKPGTEAKLFPTQEMKGVVFVWIGDEEPAPIEEDVPEEFFDPKSSIIFSDHTYWKTNWAIALENYFDAHPNYLHRDDIQALLGRPGLAPRATVESTNARFSGNGFMYSGPRAAQTFAAHDAYPSGLKWPKHRFRKMWAWFFVPFFSYTRVPAPPAKNPDWWGSDLHLPGMARVGYTRAPGQGRLRFGGGGFLGKMTRQVIAVEPDLTRLWYFHYTQPANWVQKQWHKLLYRLFYKWAGELSFSAQDGSVMPNQLWDTPEMLSPTDFGVVQWRKLVVTKHFAGRNGKFGIDKADEKARIAEAG